jgi:hypothetical protein
VPAADAPRILYLTPDYDRPSWGVGMIYEHVRLLCEGGFAARVLHRRAPFRIGWFAGRPPVVHLDTPEGRPRPQDLLVVPEVLAAAEATSGWECRRGVFAQGAFLLLRGQREVRGWDELGYSFALAVLPHVADLVRRHLGLAATVVPPFVAPYFLRSADEVRAARRRRVVLLVVKDEYRDVGFPDYQIFTGLLRRHLERHAAEGWELRELVGLGHREVAAAMAEAAFLVNLNSHEAFNTTVPEAMAAGCLPLCYDAFGGQDYLVDGSNAFVFPNHHVYPLLERTIDLMARFAAGDGQVAMRLAARETAAAFAPERTAAALTAVFSALMTPPGTA